MIELKGKSSRRIAVWMLPLTEGKEIPTDAPEFKPLALW